MSDFFLHAAIRSCLLLGMGALVWPLLPAERAVWRRRLLLGVFAALLVVPFLPTEIAAPGAVSHGNNTGTTSGISWSYLWASGSGLALLRLGWQMIGLHRLLRNARDLGEFNFEDCRLRIKESPDVHSPCVTGWSQATLLVPPGSSEWNTPRWECILRHERQHAVQQDVKAIWFIRLVSALYWWNPLVYLASRQFHIESEATCDAAVLRQGTAPREYVETLLSFSTQPHRLAPSITGQSALRKRIARFLSHQQGTDSGRLRLACGLGAALVVACFSSVCGIKPTSADKAAQSLEEEAAVRFSANPFPSNDSASGAPVIGTP